MTIYEDETYYNQLQKTILICTGKYLKVLFKNAYNGCVTLIYLVKKYY